MEYSKKWLLILFGIFISTVFIGCGSNLPGEISIVDGSGTVAGKAIIKDSSDHSGVIITLLPQEDSNNLLAAVMRYPREIRASDGFIDNLKRRFSPVSGGLSATTNEDGDFTIPEVPAGTYVVTAYKPSYVQENRPAVNVEAKKIATVDVLLDTPGTLTGNVELEGETNYAGVLVYLNNGSFTITKSDGSFKFENLNEGTYEITIKEYGFEVYQQLITIEKGTAKNLGNIILRRIASMSIFGAIAGEVRSQNLSPIQSAEITIKELPQFKAITNAIGTFLFENVPAGRYTLQVSYRYWYQEIENVSVEAKRQTTMEPIYFDLTSPEMGILEGRISPIAPSLVSVQQNGVEILSKTCNDGIFTFSLQEGVYDIIVISAGYVTNTAAKNIVVQLGETTPVDITLRPAPARISGTVIDEDSNPIEGALISLGEYEGISGDNGNFIIENILPGNYTITVSKTGYRINNSLNITLISGEDRQLGTFTLEKLPKNSIIASFNLNYNPGKMAVNTSYLYVLDPDNNKIHIYDKNDFNEVGIINTGNRPVDIVIDDTYAYVANKWSNKVGIYYLSNGNLFREIETGVYPISLEKTDNYLFVSNFGDSTIAKINLSNYEIEDIFDVGNGPIDVLVKNDCIYVLCQLSQKLQIYELENNNFIKEISVGLEPTTISANNSAVLITNAGGNSLMSVALSNNTLNNTLSNLDATPTDVKIVGENAYITAKNSGYLYEISPLTLAIIDSISVSSGIEFMAYDENTNILYISNSTIQKVFLVNTR